MNKTECKFKLQPAHKKTAYDAQNRGGGWSEAESSPALMSTILFFSNLRFELVWSADTAALSKITN